MLHLLHFSLSNLQDKAFIQQFAHQYKFRDPAILVHDAWPGQISDTRFVTKRLSNVLSECMVYNHPVSGDVRGLLQIEAGELVLDRDKLFHWFATAPLIVLNPIVATPSGPELLHDSFRLVRSLRALPEVQDVVLFPDRSLSPLARKTSVINSAADLAELQALYEEESAMLERAGRILPLRISGPDHYAL